MVLDRKALAFKQKWWQIHQPFWFRYRVGDSLEINCTSPGSSPPAKLRYYINNQMVRHSETLSGNEESIDNDCCRMMVHTQWLTDTRTHRAGSVQHSHSSSDSPGTTSKVEYLPVTSSHKVWNKSFQDNFVSTTLSPTKSNLIKADLKL